MLRGITLGQYFPADSMVHQLDPRTKVIFSLLFMSALFVINQPIEYIFIGFIILCIVFLSKVPFIIVARGLRPFLLIVLITFLANIFVTPGKTLYTFWLFEITDEGLRHGVLFALRLIFLFSITSLITLTTTPIAFADGIEKLLLPLNKVGISSHELAMMMSIALRFIPTLLEETDKIIKAQTARGVDFDKGNLIKRARNFVSLLVPLFVSAFRRADELAMAMEARCYRGGENRTKVKELRYSSIDFVAYLIGVIILLISLWFRFKPV